MIIAEKVQLLKTIPTAQLRREFESYVTMQARSVSDEIARELIAIELDRRQMEEERNEI